MTIITTTINIDLSLQGPVDASHLAVSRHSLAGPLFI